MDVPDWFPDWSGQTAVLVASGPSAKDAPLDLARGKARFIAVNDSWKLAPWADALYACDAAWWRHNEGCPEFRGLKMCIDRAAARGNEWGVRILDCFKKSDLLYPDRGSPIGWGGNSGFGALNIAVQAGAKKICLVGVDMTVSYGEHWHGRHPAGLHNPNPYNVFRWRRAFEGAVRVLEQAGVTVINCSPISALQKYPKMTLQEALQA